jgi:hypothetical protein
MGSETNRDRNSRDLEQIKNSKSLSIFWITENQSRANLVTRLERKGDLVLIPATFPNLNIIYMPKHTIEQLESELSIIEEMKLNLPATVQLLELEIKRRDKAGRIKTNPKSRTEQVRENVARHRLKKKAQKK